MNNVTFNAVKFGMPVRREQQGKEDGDYHTDQHGRNFWATGPANANLKRHCEGGFTPTQYRYGSKTYQQEVDRLATKVHGPKKTLWQQLFG